MDKDIKLYREENPNCKWCKHHHYRNKLEFFWEECDLNDKYLHEWFNWIRAKFCKYYKVKENDKDNEV